MGELTIEGAGGSGADGEGPHDAGMIDGAETDAAGPITPGFRAGGTQTRRTGLQSAGLQSAGLQSAGLQSADVRGAVLHGDGAVWRPVRGGNAFEITVARLAQAIRLGMVTTGDQLPPERELAERLQVSRVTLREAIAALRDAGYLETRRGRAGGTFVVYRDGSLPAAGPDEAAALAREMGDTLHDALDFRRVIEPGAAA